MKKNLYFIKNTFIGLIICTVVYYLALLLDINMLLAAFLFFIPFGGLIFGSIIGISAKVGMYRDGSSFDIYKKVILTVVMIGLIVFFTYLDYKTCYINNGSISRLCKGQHISKIIELGCKNFIDYFVNQYIHGTISFSAGGEELFEDNTGLSVIIYFLQYPLILIAGFMNITTGILAPKK